MVRPSLPILLFTAAPASAAWAQTSTSGSPNYGDVGSVLFYVLIGIAAVIVGGVLITILRRRIFNDSTEKGDADAKFLETLRELRRSGELSDEQYTSTRGTVLSRHEQQLAERRAASRTPEQRADAALRAAAGLDQPTPQAIPKPAPDPSPKPAPRIIEDETLAHPPPDPEPGPSDTSSEK